MIRIRILAAVCAVAALAAGCQSLTTAQKVELGCIGVETGAAIGESVAKGGAHDTAGTVSSVVDQGCAGARRAAAVVPAK